MYQDPMRHQAGKYNAFRVVLVGEAIVFLLAAALHTGAFGVPALTDAMIVEGLCGIACITSAYTVFTHKRQALKIAVIVQVFILAAVLLGVAAVLGRPEIRTPLNIGLHGVMLVLILIELSLLAIPDTRAAIRSDRS
jgi:hypothetical protein